MRLVKFIAILLVFVIFLIFVVQNVGQKITVKFFTDSKMITTEMIAALFVALVIGVLCGIMLAGGQMLTTRSTLKAVNNEYSKLKKELNYLRNKDVDDVDENE